MAPPKIKIILVSVTIDYGPFGFIDEYNPSFTPNHSDDMGRYDLENQVQYQSKLSRILDLHISVLGGGMVQIYVLKNAIYQFAKF